MAKANEAQVNEALFLKQLNKNKQAAQVAAKSERPSGIIDDKSILDRLGLVAEGDRISLPAKVSKIQMGFAKKDTNRPFFRFAYVLTENSPHSGKGKGTMVSNYHEITEGVKSDGEVYRTIEEAHEQLFFELQGIGEDTKNLSKDEKLFEKVLAMAKKHTAAKTPVQVSISVYNSEKRGLGMNITPNPILVDNSDLGDSTETSEESDEFNPDDWIGGWVTWTDDEGSIDMKVTSFDDDAFMGEDADGSEYGPAPVDECEWMDPQPGEEAE